MLRVFYWFLIEPLAIVTILTIACHFASVWRGATLSWGKCLGVGALIGIPLWLVLPAWDTQIGKARFAELCAMEAGVKVHIVVEVPKDQFTNAGLPSFFDPLSKNRRPSRLEDLFGKDYRFTYTEDVMWRAGPVSHALVTRHLQRLYSRTNGALLGERTTFYFTPGGPPWLAHTRRERCEPRLVAPENHIGEALARVVFR